jgi:hypothetical protein
MPFLLERRELRALGEGVRVVGIILHSAMCSRFAAVSGKAVFDACAARRGIAKP